jgi:hypothetical protein
MSVSGSPDPERKSMPETFEEMVERERERLTQARKDAETQLQEVQNEIAKIDREFKAIEAYERVKTGKAQKGVAVSKEPNRQRARRGERQQEVLDLIGQHPDGLTRSEILEELGAKGNKTAEASVSNALNAMKKKGQLRSEGKAYVLA